MYLMEDHRVVFMTTREKYVKRELIKLLRKNRHSQYATRLEKFYIQIVPTAEDPNCTAAMNDKDITILIGEGFLEDLKLPEDKRVIFNQLEVIIRHEMAHFYLRHQKRMAAKLPTYDKMTHSSSLFSFLNIVADDEISNTRYTAADKEIIRKMKLNGNIIGGLITEDHRTNWKDLTLEQMITELLKEIDEDNEKLLNRINLKNPASNRMPNKYDTQSWNPTTQALLNAFNAYQDINTSSIIKGDLKAFIDKGCAVNINGKQVKWAKEYREIAENIYKASISEKIDDNAVNNYLKSIANSKILNEVKLFSGPNEVVVYTPEEKYIAEEVLKKFRSRQNEWYIKVLNFLETHKKTVYATDIKDFWDEKLRK